MAVSKSETRADKLFVAFTTVKDWSAGGTKPREVWGFNAANKDIAGLTRRTKTVATEIDKILAEFGVDRFDVLTSEDKQALVAARTVMRQLGADVEHAKERVKRHFAVKKEEDRKQEEDARKAIKQAFTQVDIEETVMLLAALGETFLIRARQSRAKQHGRGYAPPVFDSPPEWGGFKPEFVFDEGRHHCISGLNAAQVRRG
jgi:hypothetical protein